MQIACHPFCPAPSAVGGQVAASVQLSVLLCIDLNVHIPPVPAHFQPMTWSYPSPIPPLLTPLLSVECLVF